MRRVLCHAYRRHFIDISVPSQQNGNAFHIYRVCLFFKVRSVTFSVIICTRNRCDALRETLSSLALVEIPDGATVEIIVVDNGSTDATRQTVTENANRSFGIRYFLEDRMGKSHALNTALREARGDILIFMDDDIRPSRGWLRGITEPIVDGLYDALSGSVVIAPHLQRPWMTGMHRAWLASTHYVDRTSPDTAVGANMSVSRKALSLVPQFDPELGPGRLGLWEDTLFSMQIKQMGMKLGFSENAVVEHFFDPARLERSSFLNHAKALGQSGAYVAWHWSHETIRWASTSLKRFRCELMLKRVFRRQSLRQGGAPLWEMNLLSGIAFNRQYLIESKRRRNYDLRGAQKKPA